MARLSSLVSDVSLNEVTKRIKQTVGFWRVQKWLVIWNLLVDPRPLKEIALHVGLAWQTARNLVSAFNRLGPAAIEGPGKGGRRREYMSLEEEREFLGPFFERASTGQIATAMQIKEAWEDRLGHSVHKTTVYGLLSRHGWRKVVPRPFHKQGKQKEQDEFKKKFPEQVSQVLATRDPHDNRQVLIMTQDEGLFGRISDPRACWAPPGIRPRVPKQIVREYLYVYAAVAPALGKMTALLLPYANTDMMNIFLREVSHDFAEFYIVMVVDRAGWHKSSGLNIPENIKFIEQPSHSPEVNPTEHLWDEIREKDFHNTVFDSMKKLEDHLCTALVKIQDDPTRLRSLTNFPYLKCDSFLKKIDALVPI